MTNETGKATMGLPRSISLLCLTVVLSALAACTVYSLGSDTECTFEKRGIGNQTVYTKISCEDDTSDEPSQ